MILIETIVRPPSCKVSEATARQLSESLSKELEARMSHAYMWPLPCHTGACIHNLHLLAKRKGSCVLKKLGPKNLIWYVFGSQFHHGTLTGPSGSLSLNAGSAGCKPWAADLKPLKPRKVSLPNKP